MISPVTHVQCWDGCTNLANVNRCVRCGHPVLILMRGVPGSGKSFLAKDLLQNTSGLILSTDDFFLHDGVYKFDPSKLQENHKRNLNQAKMALFNGVKPIIIDNTNIYIADMKPYVKQAIRHHYEIYFVEPETEWKHKPQICAMKNIHGVMKNKIEYLIDTFEHVSLANLIKPVILKLLPPADVDLEEDDYSLGKKNERLIWCFNEGNSWSSLTPTVADNSLQCLGSLEMSQKIEQEKCCAGANGVKNATDGKIENIQEKNCSSHDSDSIKKTEVYNNLPLFSLLPEPQVFLIYCQSVGVQTNDVIRTLIVREIVNVDDIRNAVIMKSEIFAIEKPKNVERLDVKDRVSQTRSSQVSTELDMLLSLFPYEFSGDLQHFLEICGFENTVRIYFEMHAKLDLFASAVQDAVLVKSSPPDIAFEAFDFNKLNFTSQPSICADSNVNIKTQLPPSSSKQRCSPDPIEDGYYRMELSLDMIQKLSDLFDGPENNMKRAYVDLPVWFCRQLFEYWHKLPITSPFEGEGFKCSDFNLTFPSVSSLRQSCDTCENDVTSNIRCINLGKKEKKAVQRKLTTAQKLQLNHLYEQFPSVDRNRIEECYYDTNFSKEAVENTLNLFLEQDESAELFNKVSSNNFCSSSQNPDYMDGKVSSSLEKHVKLNSESLRTEAGKVQDEIDYCIQQKNCLYRKAESSKYHAAKQFYITDAQEYSERIKLLIEQRNALVSQANDSRNFVDLHLMSVPAAIKLLKEKLNCLDRPQNLRNGRSDRKLIVITGYGKSSIGAVKVKPAVLQWLNQLHYDYYLPNPGEVIVTAK